MTLHSNYLKLLRREMILFIREVKEFCESKNIRVSIKNWLEYKSDSNQSLPDNINKVLGLKFPKYYLLTHIDFHDFLNSIPKDFKNDILLFLNLKKSKEYLLNNLDIIDYLKLIQKNKYYNILKRQ